MAGVAVKGPKLPTVRALAAQLRDLNRHYDGPGPVQLERYERRWHLTPLGREEIPGDNRPFDAVALARRLLADYRDAHP